MSMRTRLLASAFVALACVWIGVDVRAWLGHRHEAQEQHQVVQQVRTSDLIAQKGEDHAQAAQALAPAAHDSAQELQAARARRDRDRAALLAGQGHPKPGAPADPQAPGDPQPVVPPVDGAALVADDAAVDAAADKEKAILVDQNRLLTLAHQEDTAAIQGYKAVIAQQAAIIAARPTPRTWAVGAVYGTNQTAGGYISKDLGLVQVGVQVVRRQLAGGQTTLEAIGTAGMRF
jgi:hypothetical protein